MLTDVNGNITSDMVWDNTSEPYRVVGALYVDSGATLTILPGVEVNWGGYASLTVDGGLEADRANLDVREIYIRGTANLHDCTVGNYVFIEPSSAVTLDAVKGGYRYVRSERVSVINGVDAYTINISVPITLSQATVNNLYLSASAVIIDSTIQTVSISSAEPTITGSTIGWVAVSGAAIIENNTIGYIAVSAGNPNVRGNRFTSSMPIRIADPDLELTGFSWNTYAAASPSIGFTGSLDGSRTWGLSFVEGIGKYTILEPGVQVMTGATLTILPGVEVNWGGYASLTVDGGLEADGANLDVREIYIRGTANLHDCTVGNYMYVEPGSNITLQYSVLSGLSLKSGATTTITSNDLSNAFVSVSGDAAATISLENNWWGTTDSVAIANKIRDHADAPNLPWVDYSPWLSSSPAGGNTLAGAKNLGILASGTTLTTTDMIGDGSYGARDVHLYRFTLAQAGKVTMDVDAQKFGSTLDAYLRLFDSAGNQITANDDYDGLDPQAIRNLSPRTYYVGISGYANLAYYPRRSGSGTASRTTGSFTLIVSWGVPVLPSLNHENIELLVRQVAYDDSLWRRQNAVGVGDYRVDQVFRGINNDGFDAVGLTSPGGAPPVLVIRGTELGSSDVSDLRADADSKGVGYKQFIDNRKVVEKWLQDACKRGQRPYIVGQSLGGALAQWFAADFTSTHNDLLGEVVTFNSPGISAEWAAKFEPNETAGVTHYIDSGDIVSLAGEKFLAGKYTLFDYWEDDLGHYLTNKHNRPMLVSSYRNAANQTVSRPANLHSQTFATVDWLNSPLFGYTDPQHLVFVGALTAAAVTFTPAVADVPSKLLFRGTTEKTRSQLGSIYEQLRDRLNLTISPGAVSVSLPDMTLELPGEVKLGANGLKASYIANPMRLKIQGIASVDNLFGVSATANFGGDNYIEVTDHDIQVVGAAAVSDVTIGGYGLKNAQVRIDTPRQLVSGEVSLVLPSGKTVQGSMEFVHGKINAVHVGVDGLNIAIGQTGAFFQGLHGGVDHLSDKQGVAFDGGIGLTYGPQVTLTMPSWWPRGDYSGSLIRADLNGTVDARHLRGTGQIDLIAGLATQTGWADVNWSEKRFSAGVETHFLDGAIVMDNTIVAGSDLDITLQGNAVVRVPEHFPLIGGMTLNSAHGYFQFRNDAKGIDWVSDPAGWRSQQDWSNDFLAAWGTANIFGEKTIGFRIRFDGDFDVLNATQISSITQPFGARRLAESGESPSSAASDTFPVVAAGTPWLMLSAEWENAVGDVPVQIETPDGVLLTEADFDGTTVKILNDFGTGTRKAVGIASPQVGNWRIVVPDTTGLGQLTFGAIAGQGATEPLVIIDSPSSDVSSDGVSIQYTVSDAPEESRLTLFCDTDRNGFDGTKIDEVVASDGSQSYLWDTPNVATGNYYVYAVLVAPDGTVASSNYSAGRISVVESHTPNPVTGLTGAEGTNTTVRLTWDSSSETSPDGLVDHYLVRITSDAASDSYQQIIAASDHQLTLTGLTSGETYRVTVAAVNPAGHIGQDCEPIIVIPGGRATIPPGSGQWEVFAQPGRLYQAQVPATPGDTFALVEAPAGATLDADGQFQWNVPADVNGWQSVLVHATNAADGLKVHRFYLLVDNREPILSPELLQGEAVDATSIRIVAPDGQDSSGVLQYQLERNGAVVGNWQTSPVFMDSGLKPNTAYSYRVRTKDASPTARMSAWSETASVRTLATTPRVPLMGDPTGASVTLFAIAHDNNSPGTEYAIYRDATDGYLAANGSDSASPVWQTADVWAGLTIAGLQPDQEYRFQSVGRDASGRTTQPSAAAIIRTSRETVPPTVSSVGYVSGLLEVRFSESVIMSVKDVVLAAADGTPVDLTGATVVNSPEAEVAAIQLPLGLKAGLYTVAISGSSVQDLCGNLVDGNADGIPGDDYSGALTVTEPPAVTIDQATGQPDPTNLSPIYFTVVFSEPVTGFASAAVTLGGTAGPTTAIVTGSGTTYNVAVSGMTGSGTVIASIAAGKAHNAAGNANLASISTDNEVVFTPWHNTIAAYDVDGDGSVAPLDVLTIINYINVHLGDTVLPNDPPGTHPFYDANDDNACTPLDVLEVINYINSHPSGSGEGEMAAPTAEVASLPSLVGAPFGAAVPMFPTATELSTEPAWADSAMVSQRFPAWTQATSPPAKPRLAHVPVASAKDLHSPSGLRDGDGLFDLDGILEEIAPAIAERYGWGTHRK